ncbi:carbamoyl-phosphate synthase small subunit [Erysipelothrix larvae]|uniref:Carbamoyl phosphate synthase small chain n=1 Tax=Erysipelothrix larvae TaxID=1514105 RepID=A0A120JTT9_9FIRM|nr:carbamoyl phosphate synthase small subunit [Erysipelothrix larvae]AMC93885.1 carbamoyl-phosphate synthase small subunit [Erysipelothrix larvae]
MNRRFLICEDGTQFIGEGFGHSDTIIGELVFSTGMSGYQETLTDLSFQNQIVTFTYPLIGNAGINRDDDESLLPGCLGMICRDYAKKGSNWRSVMSLDEYLKQKGIVGLSGIDTRKLVRKLRTLGVMKAMIIDEDQITGDELKRVKAYEAPRDIIAQVSTASAYPNPNSGHKVVVIDYGLKHSILRELSKRQCDVTVVPYNTSAQTILNLRPDGVMLTNGPGDPKDMEDAVKEIQGLVGKLPIFGICMGHQLLSKAYGCDTFKMKFGHRGFNHPVREIASGSIMFTSQNHGYAVDEASVDQTQLMITHKEINDLSVEGIRHRHHPSFSVQFHPDAAPGPHDASALFDDFIELMDRFKETKTCQKEQI